MSYYKKDRDLLRNENFLRICASLVGKYRVTNDKKIERIKGFKFVKVSKSFFSTSYVPVLSEIEVEEYNINNELLEYSYSRGNRPYGFKPFVEKLQLEVKKFDDMIKHHTQFEENTVKRLKA